MDDARVAMLKLGSDSGTRTHPARHDRLAAIGNGWMKACDSDPNCGGVDKSDVFKDCITCPEMVVVPAGSFMMGSPPGEEDRRYHEGPQHRVTIAEPFAVGKYEVTRGEYAVFVRETGHVDWNFCFAYEGGGWKFRMGHGWRDPGFVQGEEHPVVCVSWHDAREYVRWLSRKTGESYRLLSESEWEYVARGGTRTARYWGEREEEQCRHANAADLTAKRYNDDWDWVVSCDDGYYQTAPVGSFTKNGFGLHDVLGNVYEWTQDCWNDSYTGALEDGRAWETGNCDERVLRGGSWFNSPWYLRAANRIWNLTGLRSYDFGFRVARTLD